MPSSLNRRAQNVPEGKLEENESLLPHNSEPLGQSLNNPKNVQRRQSSPPPTGDAFSPKFLFIACILLTVINLAVLWAKVGQDRGLASPATLFSPVNTLSSYEDVESLRRPSQFVGLDEIYKKYPHQPKNFTNFPLVLTPVDRANPSKIFDPEQGQYVKDLGVILPEHGHLQITQTISSVVQFRATDFMMENCELHITLPDISMITSAQSTYFELHKLDSTTRLRARNLSYASKPSRTGKLEEVKFDQGSDWSFRFSCARDELFTFELSCPESSEVGDCNLDWVQDKEPSSDLAGVYMMQFSND